MSYQNNPYPPGTSPAYTGGVPPGGYPPAGQYPAPGQYPTSPTVTYATPPPAGYPTGVPMAAPVSPTYTGQPVTAVAMGVGGGATVISTGGMVGPGTVMIVGGAPVLGFEPTACVCPNCRAQISTSVSYAPGLMTWILVAGLCFVGCVPCCLIPFCIPSCQDVTHTCPNCNYTLGTRTRT